MEKYLFVFVVFIAMAGMAQDEKDNKATDAEKKPAVIFNSERAVNANTNKAIGKGKMEFKINHNFDDIAGSGGGIKRFFGLDNSTDVRIGFHIGLSEKLDLIVARAKGYGGGLPKVRVTQLYEQALKYRLLTQLENDRDHPVSLSLFISNVISSMNSDYFIQKDVLGNSTDTSLNHPYTFKNFGERTSQVYQLILGKKMGRVSLQLNPTLVHRGHVPLRDQKTLFALGGAARVPVGKSVNLIVDYFHPFRSKASRNYFNLVDNSFNPPNDIDKNTEPFKFRDALGIGVEIITPGHVFHLNFTNTVEVMESRYIPATTRSWGDGQFRWAFTISRTFVLWRDKSKQSY